MGLHVTTVYGPRRPELVADGVPRVKNGVTSVRFPISMSPSALPTPSPLHVSHRNRHPRRTRTMDITDRRIIPFTIISNCHYYYCIHTHTHTPEPRVREFIRLSPCDGVFDTGGKDANGVYRFSKIFYYHY